MMKSETHVFQGMRRDNHQIRQDGKFLWDAHNIRITNREDNTLLSITNEKGTSLPLLTFREFYVGHCVLGKYLIVFTATEDDGYSYIYRVEKSGDSYNSVILYEGQLMLSPYNPIEAIGIYENELVQKVYWVDGINQPRVINIVEENPNYNNTSFDFVRTLKLHERVIVSKVYGQGEFSPGTIQYAFSYYNKYGQESNICYVTPLYYISPQDRGGSPEEKVACSFNIQIGGIDPNFNYIRIYSIHRTSIDAVPTVKLVTDISVDKKDSDGIITYLDDGITGSTVDPTLLLYIGGKSIIPETITHKDGTLFLGNYRIKNDEAIDDAKQIIQSDYEVDDYLIPTNHRAVDTGAYYSYTPVLDYANTAGFKCGETYRCGVQVQYSDGEWSEPIFLTDTTLCSVFPWETYPYRESKSIHILGEGLGNELRSKGIRKIRSCIVFPASSKTEVICQGVLCPTLRKADSEWNFNSSWFFRPSVLSLGDNNTDIYHGASIEFRHNMLLKTGADRGAEIQGMTNPANGGGNGYLVDENVVTFHSPDLEFNNSVQSMDLSGTRLRVVGMAKLGAIYGDINIQTETPGINKNGASGFSSPVIGYQTGSKLSFNGGLVSGLFYHDNQVKKDTNGNYSSGDTLNYWMVYPWHRSGSLNNDENRATGKGTRTAVLSKKKLSNLKFFDENSGLSGSSPVFYDISTPQLFNSNELTLTKLSPVYLGKDVTYLGNVDTMVTNSEYKIYQGSEFADSIVETAGTDVINSSSEPVRIKYKSSPHLVFSLGKDKTSIELLPRHKSLGGPQNESYTLPDWMQPDTSVDRNIFEGILYLYTTEELERSGSVDSSLLGKYAIGSWSNQTSGTYGSGLYQCKKQRGAIRWVYVSVPSEGIILKAVETVISPSTHYLPGTTSGNYSTRGNYTKLWGITKYYRITYNTTNYSIEMEDVTEECKDDPASDKTTFTLKRVAFGGDTDTLEGRPYLLIGELIRDNIDNKFGKEDENLWFPAGEPVEVLSNTNELTVPFQYGDTWYSRYDCLKTYPFTQEDENQVIEVGSFMCETRVNIDGRYDKNRGQLSNLNMTPQNFNLINEVYTQKDTFFNYRILDKDYYRNNRFANQVTWSKQKNAGEETDSWTNITLANTLDMDGSKGDITALRTFNESLICFQEKAVSQILFNSRVQIPVTDGVPIEIANGYKVDGSRLLSGNIGCSNKWSVVVTSAGVYFIDTNTDSIYIFNGQFINLSEDRGMDWWVRQNHTGNIWRPMDPGTGNLNGVRTLYDNKYGDIYFTPGPVYGIDQPDALCYSEQLGQFTSLMSYGGTQAMFNFADGFYSLRGHDNTVELYQNNVGEYNNFYGTTKGWNFSFISNQNPTLTKIFDTIELRADHYWPVDAEQPLNSCPVNHIEVKNEYQEASATLDEDNTRKKFRIWRSLIPRSFKVAGFGTGTDITRQKYGKARIRNPWAMITLGWTPPINTEQPDDNTKRAVVHDVTVNYTV